MFNMTKIKAVRGDGRSFYMNHLSSNDYYSENEKVKGCVRVAIANALNDGEIALSDSQRLQSILIKHFC